MMWYAYPSYIIKILFIMYLSSAVLQTILILDLPEWIKEQQNRLVIKIIYLLFLCISLVYAAEFVCAISAIDIGAFIPVVKVFRYICVLPMLIYFYLLIKSIKIPKEYANITVSFFIPLIRLPQMDEINEFMTVFFATFTAIWFIFDALYMLFVGRKHSNSDITRDILRYMIQSMDYGICIADHNGFVIESNDAFEEICHSFGLLNIDSVINIEASIKVLSDQGLLSILVKDNYRVLKKANFACLLRQETFRTLFKTYIQISISDISFIQNKITELEEENTRLENTNKELEKVKDNITIEESIRQREKLNRITHYSWSHKLAITGISLDMLIKKIKEGSTKDTMIDFPEIKRILVSDKNFSEEEGLSEFLSIMVTMYKELGVLVNIIGEVNFSDEQQKALCSVIKEGLANAVRHAYSR